MSNYSLEELKIEVTYNCPLACVHCSSNAGAENKAFITAEKCFEIIEQAAPMGVKTISFSGGEPLTWPALPKAVQLCKKLSIIPQIYTSGNCTEIMQTFEELADSGLDKAVFSVYSACEQEHIRITRKRNSFKNTLEAISVCNRLGIKTEIHFVALASNYMRLPEIVDLAKTNGVKSISVLRFVPQGRGALIKDRDTLSFEDNVRLKHIIEEIRSTGFEIRTGSPFNVLLLNQEPKCMAAKDRMIIAPNLYVYPCDAFKQVSASEIVSDTAFCSLEKCGLEECWNNSTYLQEIRNVSGQISESCKDCALYAKCKSGCLAQKFLTYGKLFGLRDPACLNRSAKK